MLATMERWLSAQLKQQATTADTPKKMPLKRSHMQHWYDRPPSFVSQLPWVDFNRDEQLILLEDGISVGAVLELVPVACEARPESYLQELSQRIHTALVHALPEEEPHWIVQTYIQREPILKSWSEKLSNYVAKAHRDSAYTQHYLQCMTEHFSHIGASEGYFFDDAVTRSPWRASHHTVRCVLYRRLHRYYRSPLGLTPEQELALARDRLTESLMAAGIACRRLNHRGLLHWLIRWFNPAPIAPEVWDWLATLDDDPEALPFGDDLAERLLLNMPRSEQETGYWYFDDRPHSCLTLQKLLSRPTIGHMTAERSIGARLGSLWDLLPDSSILAITMVAKPQDQIMDQIERLEGRAVGASPESARARADYARAKQQIAEGNKLYPANLALYLNAASTNALRALEDRVVAQLLSERLKPIARENDLLRLNAYLSNLPCNFDPALDQKAHWARLHYTDHLAQLMPFYGRARGTGHPGVLCYNRGGEPFTFDPLNAQDRKKNGHMLILGPTGSGKSSKLLEILSQTLAIHRPRIFLTEVGRSFELFGEHLARMGLTVHRLTLAPGQQARLSLFQDALYVNEDDLNSTSDSDDEHHWLTADGEEAERLNQRDLLAEMEVTAALMVTGGEEIEIQRMKRADRRLLQRAIILAGSHARKTQQVHVLPKDVSAALRQLPDVEGSRRERAIDMADCIDMYTSGFSGEVFNQPGEPWPDADVTIVNLGLFANEGQEDKLALSVIGLVNHINALAEQQRYDERQTIMCFDEAHIVTTHVMLAPYLTKACKVWGRRYAVWLWLATQNMGDFPVLAKRMLAMIEWWIALFMPQDEIEQLQRFRELTPEQMALLKAVRKSPGNYTEGVLLHESDVSLFRNVPPPLMLALAQTEKEERAQRRKLMDEHQISELEAAYRIAEQIQTQRTAGAARATHHAPR